VGNNIGGPASEELKHATSDATKIRHALLDVGGFDPSNIAVLLDKSSEDVRETLQSMETRIAAEAVSGGEPAMLLFYYSGHGQPGWLELGESKLFVEDLKAHFKASRATMRVAIVDACHSGALVRAKGGRRTSEFPITVEDHLSSQGYAILTSSALGESSHESDDLSGSYFTHSLVSGMRGDADYSQDGQVTLAELYQYTYNATVRRSHSGGGQHPHFESAQSGDVVLTQLHRASAMLTFPHALAGEFMVVAGGTTVVAEVLKRAGEARSIALEPGDFEVFVREGEGLRSAALRVEKGRETIVDPSLLEPRALPRLASRGPETSVELGVRAGMTLFGDAEFRSEYFQNTPAFGVEVRVRDVGVAGLDIGVESMFGVARQEVRQGDDSVTQDAFFSQLAMSVLWRWNFSALELALGPKVAWIYLRRSVDAGATGGGGLQTFSTVSPGARVSLGYRVHSAVLLSVEGASSFLRVDTESGPRDMVTGDIFGAVSISF
jgi:hypothetical protein